MAEFSEAGGYTLIKSMRINVSFHDIKLTPDIHHGVLVAISGTAKGIAGPTLEYDLDAFHVSLRRDSLRLEVNSSTAEILVSVPNPSFFTISPTDNLFLTSQSCDIAPDGSIAARNFRGLSSFLLKDSVYRMKISGSDDQTVSLGQAFSRLRFTPGCQLRGIASRDNVELFSFQGIISPNGIDAFFELNLLATIERTPVAGYKLELLSGSVFYNYSIGGLQNCQGTFKANLTLPQEVLDETNNPISRVTQVDLKTDKTGEIFGFISIPKKIKAGFDSSSPRAKSLFLIEPNENSCWAYFPMWHAQGSQSISPIKTGRSCQQILNLLESDSSQSGEVNSDLHKVRSRPGLTILQGKLYFLAPQVKLSDQTLQYKDYKIITKFWGGLTLLSGGIFGELTSLNCSFVPARKDVEDGLIPTKSDHYSWKQILAMHDKKPVEPIERFRLADLRILELWIKRLQFCFNAMQSGPIFRYIVHFPWPSYIDLEFEDLSLNKEGLFQEGKGPICSVSQEFDQAPSLGIFPRLTNGTSPMVEAKKLAQNPDTYILWAWRLPISFSDRGVAIKYRALSEPIIRVIRKPNDPANLRIFSSEIWLRPLFSRNSGIKKGVRFGAVFTTRGKFQLIDWDTEVFVAKMYAPNERVLAEGFNCILKGITEGGITLADYNSNPDLREYDHYWKGKIDFPFFDTFDSEFRIKNLNPTLIKPVAFAETTKGRCCCEVDANGDYRYYLCNETIIADGLKAKTYSLKYIEGTFISDETRLCTIIDSQLSSPQDGSLHVSSFTNARFMPRDIIKEDIDLNEDLLVGQGGPIPGRVINRLKDAVSSEHIKDLVNYDLDAMKARGICDPCISNYYIGTYQVIDSSSGSESVILSSPQTKWYPTCQTPKIEIGSSDIVLQSGEAETKPIVIGVPGAQLSLTSYGLYGEFGATYTPVASELPYEGEFRFFLDTSNGYFYMLGAGTFTYYLTFRGETLIVHAPYGSLKYNPGFVGSTQLLEDLSTRALFSRVEEFTELIGFRGLTDDTVITGLFHAGNVSYTLGIGDTGIGVELTAGGGTYMFQFKLPQGSAKFRLGSFVKAKASADLYVVSASGEASFATILDSDLDLEHLNNVLSNSELILAGTLTLRGCVSAKLGHCEGRLICSGHFSTKSGFDLSVDKLKAGCDWGDCD